MKKSNVYTRTGDQGLTSLVGGERVPKCCDRLEAYGTVDELNSHIGLLATLCNDTTVITLLHSIQNTLFTVGSYLATDTSTTTLRPQSVVSEEKVQELEQQIDRLDSELPQLRAFVLPGGTQASAQAHVARTVCRRAERCMLRLAETCPIDTQVSAYVNRLSDLLFVLARHLNVTAGQEDLVWRS